MITDLLIINIELIAVRAVFWLLVITILYLLFIIIRESRPPGPGGTKS